MKRKNRPAAKQSLATSTAERIGAIVEAAERAAVAVIDDAEKQAGRHLEEARTEAERLAAERLSSLTDLTDSLVAQADVVQVESERLVAKLEEAKRLLGSDGGGRQEPENEEELESVRASHLSAVPERGATPVPGEGTPAGARLLATQMAVSGSSREEIEARLRNGFEIEDAAAILDAILGPEE